MRVPLLCLLVLFLLPRCFCCHATAGVLASLLLLGRWQRGWSLRLDLVAYTSAEVSHSCASVKFLMLLSTREF